MYNILSTSCNESIITFDPSLIAFLIRWNSSIFGIHEAMARIGRTNGRSTICLYRLFFLALFNSIDHFLLPLEITETMTALASKYSRPPKPYHAVPSTSATLLM
jgi:hypothetical protein